MRASCARAKERRRKIFHQRCASVTSKCNFSDRPVERVRKSGRISPERSKNCNFPNYYEPSEANFPPKDWDAIMRSRNSAAVLAFFFLLSVQIASGSAFDLPPQIGLGGKLAFGRGEGGSNEKEDVYPRADHREIEGDPGFASRGAPCSSCQFVFQQGHQKVSISPMCKVHTGTFVTWFFMVFQHDCIKLQRAPRMGPTVPPSEATCSSAALASYGSNIFGSKSYRVLEVLESQTSLLFVVSSLEPQVIYPRSLGWG